MDAILETLVKGLTYDGNSQAMIINYALLALTLAPFLLGSVVKRGTWVICFVISLLAQVVLWFVADAIGISVVWSAMAGFLGMTYFNRGADQSALVIGVLVISVAAIVFYAITYPILTTIAHVISMLVGAIIYFVTAEPTK